MASLGVSRAALLCWLHDPAPTAAKPSARKGPEPPLHRPALEVLHPEEDQGRRGCGGRRGARGCAAAASGSLITSARSAPARSSQLPSNTREFNSSINRREALHFGERWRGWVGLGGGPHDSTGEQAGMPPEHGCEALRPRGPATPEGRGGSPEVASTLPRSRVLSGRREVKSVGEQSQGLPRGGKEGRTLRPPRLTSLPLDGVPPVGEGLWGWERPGLTEARGGGEGE